MGKLYNGNGTKEKGAPCEPTYITTQFILHT